MANSAETEVAALRRLPRFARNDIGCLEFGEFEFRYCLGFGA